MVVDVRTLAERIGEAMRRRRPDANLTGWFARIADAAGVSENTVRNWHYGEAEPTGSGLLALFDHFGPDFEAEVRGGEEPTPVTARERIEIIRAELRALERALPPNTTLKVVS